MIEDEEQSWHEGGAECSIWFPIGMGLTVLLLLLLVGAALWTKA